MSDTPRTDASYDAWHGNAPRDNIWSLARDLERDLATARELNVGYQIQLNEKSARIAELEEFKEQATKNYDQLYRNRDRMELERNEARRRIAELEAELAAARMLVTELHENCRDWRRLTQEANARIAALEAERDEGLKREMDLRKCIEDEAAQIFRRDLATANARIAALEADHTRLLAAYDCATDLLEDRSPEPINVKLERLKIAHAAFAAAPQPEEKP
jgi:chromosome segregation ATPase